MYVAIHWWLKLHQQSIDLPHVFTDFYTYLLDSLMLFAIASWPHFTATSRGVR